MMVQPVLTLLIASSIQLTAEAPCAPDLGQIVLSIAEVIEAAPAPFVPPAEEPTVRDVPFYYDRLAPVPVPAVVPPVTYDWRSPVIFDLP